jgi:hypothetical protein
MDELQDEELYASEQYGGVLVPADRVIRSRIVTEETGQGRLVAGL